MAVQTYVCDCGQEFEASEFSLCRECEDCRTPLRTGLDSPWLQVAEPQWQAAYENYTITSAAMLQNAPIGARVGDTVTFRVPTRLFSSGILEGPTRFVEDRPDHYEFILDNQLQQGQQ